MAMFILPLRGFGVRKREDRIRLSMVAVMWFTG